MKSEHDPAPQEGADDNAAFTDIIPKWEESCRNCHSLSPVACISNCRVWEMKNEFQRIYKKMKDPCFIMNLLNTLKNGRRLKILELLSKERCSLERIQHQLKKQGYIHSKKTIVEEYVNPLVEIGLAGEDKSRYCATLFGCRLNESLGDFHGFGKILPSHSECYEEAALRMLANKPGTYDDFGSIIPARSVARILSRLQKARLLETTKSNEYVFYFRTKRGSKGEKFLSTEKRVYENIPFDGISAQKLAEKTAISLRRTYKYLRRLRGKKLVFARSRAKSYALTAKGVQVALILQKILSLVMEVQLIANKIVNKDETHELVMPETYQRIEK